MSKYYVETCFLADDDRLLVDHAETNCFDNLELAQKHANDWVCDDDRHEAVIWQEIENITSKKETK